MTRTTKKGIETQMTIDYREAFVVTMEMAAHGPCKQCVLSGLHGKPEEACHKMQYMREYVRQAYQALPPYYKDRYVLALNTAITSSQEAIDQALRR